MYNGIYTIDNYAYMHDTLVKWLKDKISGVSLGDKLREMSVHRVAIYGANELGQIVYNDINDMVKIENYIDKNAAKYNGYINGIRVLSLEELAELSDDCYILVTPEMYFNDILEDLLAKKVRLEKIISLSMVV